jgi:hypothetical protein
VKPPGPPPRAPQRNDHHLLTPERGVSGHPHALTARSGLGQFAWSWMVVKRSSTTPYPTDLPPNNRGVGVYCQTFIARDPDWFGTQATPGGLCASNGVLAFGGDLFVGTECCLRAVPSAAIRIDLGVGHLRERRVHSRAIAQRRHPSDARPSAPVHCRPPPAPISNNCSPPPARPLSRLRGPSLRARAALRPRPGRLPPEASIAASPRATRPVAEDLALECGRE